MRALTLWRPWGNAIILHGKDVENRTWAPPRDIIGQRIAIHNGQKVDGEGCSAVMELLRRGKPAYAIDSHKLLGPAGCVIGVVRVTGFCRESDSPWFCGPFGWLLAEPFLLQQPIRCRGAQGLWTIPPDVERAMHEQAWYPI